MRPAGSKSSQDTTSTNKKLGMVAHACHPSYMESVVQISLGKKHLKQKGPGEWFKR
jgi:hypothetical protein